MLVQGLMRQCTVASKAAPARCALQQLRGSCISSRPSWPVHRAAQLQPVQHGQQQQQQQQQQRRHCTQLTAAATETSSVSAAPAVAVARPTANLVSVLRSRGLIQDVTSEELEKVLDSSCVSLYCGFDPTADSLHLGNLLGIIVLAWAGACGHTPIALLGGATGRVGDPSGRSSERPVLSEAEIQRNIDAIGQTLNTVLSRASSQLAVATDGSVTYSTASNGTGSSSGSSVSVLNNLDWFGPMSFLDFLRDIGKHARVGQMLAKESVRSRMESESGISFTEFTYQLLQGYDFVHLARTHGVKLQVGGSDQWGNITAGTDLIRKLMSGDSDEDAAPQCFGLTFPLLVDSEGRKFGKSTGGAIWLSAEKLSPYKFYQYLFQEIEALQQAMRQPDYVPNTAQKRLAEAVTRFVHGEEGLAQAVKATEALRPGAATALDASTLEAIAGDAPSCSLAAAQVTDIPLVDVMVASGMLKSKGEVRRLIKGGGVYMNNAKVLEQDKVVKADDLIEGKLLLLAAGKKNKMLVRLSS